MSFYSSNIETQTKPSAIDISSVMRQVYLWMTLGLFVCFGVSSYLGNMAQQAYAAQESFFLLNPTFTIVMLIAYLIFAFTIQPLIMRTSPNVGAILFLAFTALFGVMLSSIWILYSPTSIGVAFLTTAAMFAAMSIYGYTTKADLSKMGNILFMALIGLILATVINFFAKSTMLYWLVSYAGVIIFAGFTAYDTQWIKNTANQIAATTNSLDVIRRIALIGALHLFLDFVNLFMFLLRIMGNSRD